MAGSGRVLLPAMAHTQDTNTEDRRKGKLEPEPIEGETMESFAQAVFAAPPKKNWRYRQQR